MGGRPFLCPLLLVLVLAVAAYYSILSASSLPRMPPPAFLADPLAAQLAAGERPETYGLTVVAGWPAPADLRTAYTAWAAQLAAALPGEPLLVYPADHLHVTVATLASFRSGHLREAAMDVRDHHRRLWTQVLQAAVDEARAAGRWPNAFALEPARPFLSAAAGCLSYTDAGGQLAAIREVVRRARQLMQAAHPEVPVGEPQDFNVPTIAHSTVLRFAQAPTAPQKVAEAFEQAAAQWLAVAPPLVIGEVVLAVEDRPYMHVPEDRAAAVFKLG